MKRGRLYAAARANGYNVLALGQHLDDLAESFLMSTFHNGRLRTMKAHYHIKLVIPISIFSIYKYFLKSSFVLLIAHYTLSLGKETLELFVPLFM